MRRFDEIFCQKSMRVIFFHFDTVTLRQSITVVTFPDGLGLVTNLQVYEEVVHADDINIFNCSCPSRRTRPGPKLHVYGVIYGDDIIISTLVLQFYQSSSSWFDWQQCSKCSSFITFDQNEASNTFSLASKSIKLTISDRNHKDSFLFEFLFVLLWFFSSSSAMIDGLSKADLRLWKMPKRFLKT